MMRQPFFLLRAPRDNEISINSSSSRRSSKGELKKCPSCGSISQDSHVSCGVCGEDISSIVSRDLSVLKAEQQPKAQSKTQVHPKGIAILGTGFGTMAIGVYLLFASGVIGLFLVLIGITVAAASLRIEGSFTGTVWSSDASNEYRERRAKDRWDKERANQEREVEE